VLEFGKTKLIFKRAVTWDIKKLEPTIALLS
jgi:hypothetical protein